jgi:protoheme IX farnesyltransferase
VTHGDEFTRQFILLYTILLVVVTVLPYLSGLSGLIYLVTALALGVRFLYFSIRLKVDSRRDLPMRVFRYSINYLMILFAALLIDHYYLIRFGL